MAGIEDWVRVCTVDDIPLLGARVLEREGGDDIALFRPASERVFALEGLPDPWAARIAGAQKREYTPLKLGPPKPDRQIAVALEE